MTYDIIQVNTNSYDIPYSCADSTVRTAYLMCDKDIIVPSGWKLSLIESNKDYPFDTVFNIRWHPFLYSNADYVIWVDGSLEIKKTLYPIINQLDSINADIGLLIHPFRTNVYDEYFTWITDRHYDKETAFKWLAMMTLHGYNPRQPTLYQTNIIVFKNTQKTKTFCELVWTYLHTLNRTHADRLDQTIATYVAMHIYKDLTICDLHPEIYTQSQYFISHWKH